MHRMKLRVSAGILMEAQRREDPAVPREVGFVNPGGGTLLSGCETPGALDSGGPRSARPSDETPEARRLPTCDALECRYP